MRKAENSVFQSDYAIFTDAISTHLDARMSYKMSLKILVCRKTFAALRTQKTIQLQH